MIQCCNNSCRMKTSTPQTPKRAKRGVRTSARTNLYKKDINQIVQKNVEKADLSVKKISFLNFWKNKSMTPAKAPKIENSKLHLST